MWQIAYSTPTPNQPQFRQTFQYWFEKEQQLGSQTEMVSSPRPSTGQMYETLEIYVLSLLSVSLAVKWEQYFNLWVC